MKSVPLWVQQMVLWVWLCGAEGWQWRDEKKAHHVLDRPPWLQQQPQGGSSYCCNSRWHIHGLIGLNFGQVYSMLNCFTREWKYMWTFFGRPLDSYSLHVSCFYKLRVKPSTHSEERIKWQAIGTRIQQWCRAFYRSYPVQMMCPNTCLTSHLATGIQAQGKSSKSK